MAKVYRPPQTTPKPNPGPEKKPDGKTLLQRWKEKVENNKVTAVILFLVFVLGTVATSIKFWKDIFPSGDIKPPQAIEIRIKSDSPKVVDPPVVVKKKFHLTKLLSLSIDKVKMLENLTGMEFADGNEGKEISVKIISGGLRSLELGSEKIFRVTGGDVEITINGMECCIYDSAFPSVKTDMTEAEATARMWANIKKHLQESTDLIPKISQCLKN
jgi:hypothetical protein